MGELQKAAKVVQLEITSVPKRILNINMSKCIKRLLLT